MGQARVRKYSDRNDIGDAVVVILSGCYGATSLRPSQSKSFYEYIHRLSQIYLKILAKVQYKINI